MPTNLTKTFLAAPQVRDQLEIMWERQRTENADDDVRRIYRLTYHKTVQSASTGKNAAFVNFVLSEQLGAIYLTIGKAPNGQPVNVNYLGPWNVERYTVTDLKDGNSRIDVVAIRTGSWKSEENTDDGKIS